MTLSTLATTTDVPALPDFADDPAFGEAVLAEIGKLVDLDRRGVRTDVDRWVTWTLVGGFYRPRANLRAVSVNGVNAIRVTQDQICAALEQYYDQLDMDNSQHFALLERATRPLPANAR